MNNEHLFFINSFEVNVVNRTRSLLAWGTIAGILILILDSKTALSGAKKGLDLCIQTVIPSLFPLLVLSGTLVGLLSGLSIPILRPLSHLCGIPAGEESLLIAGLLGGYPVGAKCIAESYHKGELSSKEAERLLAFCNNAGPAFIFGMCGTLFTNQYIPWILWGIHIFSAVLVAKILSGNNYTNTEKKKFDIPSSSKGLSSSVRVMGTICGWVILFRTVIAFFQKWILWMVPIEVSAAIVGILELSNGCIYLHQISDFSVRFILCSAMLAFGGLCVTMQTISVTVGLSLQNYRSGKILQTIFSLLFSFCFVYGGWVSLLLALVVLFVICFETKNISSIPIRNRV